MRLQERFEVRTQFATLAKYFPLRRQTVERAACSILKTKQNIFSLDEAFDKQTKHGPTFKQTQAC
jgi:hypothetical protein